MTVRRLALTAALLLATRASAQTFPARSGELGVLDVPDAEVAGRGHNYVGAELRFDRVSGRANEFGPLPAYAVIGVAPTFDLGFTMREWGQPGDPGNKTLIGAAAKLQLIAPQRDLPGLALSTTFDKINDAGVLGARAAASTRLLPIRLAAYLGYEHGSGADGKNGPGAGLAATLPLDQVTDLAAEAVAGPRGPNFGLAVRWVASRVTGISLGLNYLPKDEGVRLSVGFAFWPSRGRGHAPAAPTLAPEAEPEEELEARAFEERPHFRLRMDVAERFATARHLQYGPFVASAAAQRGAAANGQTQAAAPSLENLAAAQIKELEALADARERRARATSEQLDAREKAALEDQKNLDERERKLAAREAQLEAREQRLGRTSPTPQQQQLVSFEAQLAAQERTLSAQERALRPAIEAAQGREQEAASREGAERQEASRLSASVSGAPNQAQQLEIRKQAVSARNRQLGAFEARLVARGERVDGLERSLRTKGERLGAMDRRLGARAERLDAIEQRPAEPLPATGAVPRAPGAPGAAPEKAVFALVVKAPTSIVKQGGGGAQASDLPTGAAIETAVAAATVVGFPTPASALSELDRESFDNIARVAASSNCELLIWARAKEPGLMAEAQRRANELKVRALAAAPLREAQVVTRVTTRPGAQGVDVVVSALRATQQAAPAASRAGQLEPGETGKRQVREAVVAAQASIEACVGGLVERTHRTRADGTLRLSVSGQGRVTRVGTVGDDLAGPELEACLGRASAGWSFPPADAAYVVDVPITVIRGGAAK